VLSTVRYSMISDAPSKQTTQSKYSPLQKKSTLRSAIGRLFGRGKKKNGTGNQDVVGVRTERESRPLGSAQHRSVSTPSGIRSNVTGPFVTDIYELGSHRSWSSLPEIAQALSLVAPERVRSATPFSLDWTGRHHGYRERPQLPTGRGGWTRVQRSHPTASCDCGRP
jgi:hypothetical protein